jgi:hypothetical protein
MPTSPQHTFEPSTAKLDPLYPNAGAKTINVRLAAGTYPKGQVLGETATPGIYGVYVNATATDPAKGILQYGCVVDASGNVTLAGEFGQTQRGVPMYIGGGAVFNTTELTGLDAGAITDLGASLIQGSIANGQLRF